MKKVNEIENIDGILEHRYNVLNVLTNLEHKLKIYDSFYLVNNQNTIIKKSSFTINLIKSIGIGFILSILIISILEFVAFVKSIHDHPHQNTDKI